MNPVAKRIGQVVAGFGLLFAAALAFQNCSGYQMYDSSQLTNLPSSCSGANCNSQDVMGLKILLTNSKITVNLADLPSSNRVVDIGGYCDDADFAQTNLQYEWVDGSTAITPWQGTSVPCDDLGRFSFRATVPSSITVSRTYRLYVRLAVPNLEDQSPYTSVLIEFK